MSKLKRLDKLFNIEYPRTLVFGHQTKDPSGIPFVTSTGRNNGVAGTVRPIQKAKLYPAGSITVPLKGSVMAAHLQPRDFYCAHQIAVLVPKKKMTEKEKLYYVLCLKLNKERFNYGRQADRTLKQIEVPSRPPKWVYGVSMRELTWTMTKGEHSKSKSAKR